jgi:rhodanese-related sulfurtransferase
MKCVSLYTLILATFSLASCQSGQSKLEGPVVEKLDVPTFAQALKDNPKAQLVDVRTPAEYQKGTIEGSRHINFYGEDFTAQLEAQLDKNRPVYLFDRSGIRSGKAAVIMEELDFKKIYDLDGGFLAWNGVRGY